MSYIFNYKYSVYYKKTNNKNKMEKDIILTFIRKNKKEMKSEDFNSFIKSDNYNNLDNKEARRIVFYIESFLKSTNNYTKFNILINDFQTIIKSINENEYLQKTHECYKTLLCNFLQNILSLIMNENVLCENTFVSELNIFVDLIEKIYYPNQDMKLDIIKYFISIKKNLEENKNKITKDNTDRFEQYLKIIKKYITENNAQKKEKENLNSINDNSNDSSNNNFNDINFSIINNNSLEKISISKDMHLNENKSNFEIDNKDLENEKIKYEINPSYINSSKVLEQNNINIINNKNKDINQKEKEMLKQNIFIQSDYNKVNPNINDSYNSNYCHENHTFNNIQKNIEDNNF